MGQYIRATESKDLITKVSSITRPGNTTAYAADDAVSDATDDAHLTFSGVAQAGRLSSTIVGATASSSHDAGATLPDLQLILFRKDFTDIADNAMLEISDAEALTVIGVIDFPVANWVGMNSSSVCHVADLALDIKTGQDGPDNNVEIYGQLVMKNAYTPASGEVISVELVINRH